MKLKIVSPNFDEEWEKIKEDHIKKINCEVSNFIEEQKKRRKKNRYAYIIVTGSFLLSFASGIGFLGVYGSEELSLRYLVIFITFAGICLHAFVRLNKFPDMNQEELEKGITQIIHMLDQLHVWDNYEKINMQYLKEATATVEKFFMPGIRSLICSVNRLYAMNTLLESNIVDHDYISKEKDTLVNLNVTIADASGRIRVESYVGTFQRNFNIESDQLELINGEFVFTQKYIPKG